MKRAFKTIDNNAKSEKANEDPINIFFSLNCSDETAERMVKSCMKKLHKSIKPEINVKLSHTIKLQTCCFWQIQKVKHRV